MSPPQATHIPTSRRKGGSVFLVDMDIDNHAAQTARRDLARGRFEAADTLLSAQRDPNERAYYVEALADWPGEPRFLADWMQTTSPHASTVAAVQRMKWAWEARGGGRGSSLGTNAINEFMRRLPDARDQLIAAARKHPREATVFPWLMWCARGLGEPELSRKAFAESVRRQPAFRLAYSSELLTHCRQWYGSQEEVLEFAREHVWSAPSGVGVACLIVEAHKFITDDLEPDDERIAAYWTSPTVRSDMETAHQTCTTQGFSGMNGLRARHWLAFGLWKSGHHALAATHFPYLDVWNENPWGGYRHGFNWLLNPFGKAKRQSMKAQ